MSLDDRINDACHRIEDLYNETDGKCYVSFSGGKDSTVLLALIKMCEELYTIPEGGIPAVFVNTGIEMGITVDFVRWVKEYYYPNLIEIRPEHSFDWCLKNYGKPIMSKLRAGFLNSWQKGVRTDSLYMNFIIGITKSGHHASRTKIADKDCHMLSDDFPIHPSQHCCDVLKKKPFLMYARENEMKGAIIGLRSDEGGARAFHSVKYGTRERICTTVSHGIIKKSPLIDWSNEDEEQFIIKYQVPLSKAYTDFGFDRTGCMACPYSKTVYHDLYYLHEHEPNRYKASMHWLKDVYIAQNVILPFDEEYEKERERMWFEVYEPMRQEMLRKYRPNSRLIKDYDQTNIFEFMEEKS